MYAPIVFNTPQSAFFLERILRYRVLLTSLILLLIKTTLERETGGKEKHLKGLLIALPEVAASDKLIVAQR